MNKRIFVLPLLCVCAVVAAQNHIISEKQEVGGEVHGADTTDVFYRHLDIGEVTVVGITGETKLKHSSYPVNLIGAQDLRATPSTNIVDAVSHQPGISQLTTGSGISKPIIRGLGYNRVVVVSEGVRQEGQQWGDEHGVEVDGNSVGSVEVIKGPASLMYGSDAMAGVLILHPQPPLATGDLHANVSTEYQTNNGLFAYTLSMCGRREGFVWDARYSDKMAHAYKNKVDGYVPGSQFRERAGRLMLGLNKGWGHSRLTWTAYHLTPGIIEGERDEDTGALLWAEGASAKSYGKALPFQQVRHYKLVWDNALNLGAGYLKAIVGYQQNRRKEFEESMDDYELFFKLHTLTYDLRFLSNEWQGWKFSVGVGGMYQHSGNHGEESLIPDYRLFDFGAYATASKQLANRWTLNGGLRYDHRRMRWLPMVGGEEPSTSSGGLRHFDGMTGSMGTVWNVTDALNLRLNVARGFRTPNMSELGSDGVHEGSIRYEVGNHRLKAEYSLQADLGLDFTSRYVSAQLALFANRIDHYIFTHRLAEEREAGYLTYGYTQGDARLLGFEAGIDLHPIHSLHVANTFSYVDAQLLHQSSATRYLPFTPAPRWTSELKWELMHHSHGTLAHHHADGMPHRHAAPRQLSLNNTYVAAHQETYLRQNHFYRADDTETATPGYMLLCLSAGTDVQMCGRRVATVSLAVDNLLDRASQNHLSRLKYAPVNPVTGQQGICGMGRNVVLRVAFDVL